MMQTMAAKRPVGRPPKGGERVPVSARVDKEIVDKLDEMAAWDYRDRSDMIAFAVRDYVKAHYDELKAKHGKAR